MEFLVKVTLKKKNKIKDVLLTLCEYTDNDFQKAGAEKTPSVSLQRKIKLTLTEYFNATGQQESYLKLIV